jgi:prephenate dehydrogenase
MLEPSVPTETCLAILGPGLLGGSVALAARRRWPALRIQVWARRSGALAGVEALGVADRVTVDLAEVVAGATLVVLATPVETMPDLAAQLAALPLEKGAVVTDVGSVKGFVVERLEPLFAGGTAQFVGSHPMAGSERAGIEAARGDLFDGAACLVTPTAQTEGAAVERVRGFWQGLGCRVIEMSPEQHDRAVARVSHLPHLMAAVTTLAGLSRDPEVLRCAGNGFRDTTRVAAGDPGLWTGIVAQNRTEILAAVRDAEGQIRVLLEMLESLDEDSLCQWFAEAKSLRDRLPGPPLSQG